MKKNIYTLTLVFMVLLISTCGPDNYYVYVVGIRPPESDCTFKPGDVYRAWGTADASLITTISNLGYVAGIQVENRMLNTKDVTKKPGGMEDIPMRTDANYVVFKKIYVTLRAVSQSKTTNTTTTLKPSKYYMEINQTIVPSAGDETTPGTAIVLAPLVPKEKLIELEMVMPEWPTDTTTYVDLIAEFYLEGETLGGRYVRTNDYNYYIKVCFGCLNFLGNKTYAQCLMDSNCELSGNVCLPGQDDIIICTCE